MRNYLALLGWSFDDHTTVMSTDELVERFTLERVTKSPAVFDFQKLEWLNGEHLRALPPDAVRRRAARGTCATPARRWPTRPTRVREVAPMVQDKLRELGGFEDFAGFLFRPVRMDPEAWAKVEQDPDAPRSLARRRGPAVGAGGVGGGARSRRRCARPARTPG